MTTFLLHRSLGRGVGLEVPEPPNLGLAGGETLTDYPYDL